MKPFAACFSLALLSGAFGSPGSPSAVELNKWEDFKALHGKQHAAHEEPSRRERFLRRVAEIEEHNARYEAGLESFSLKLNAYSDMSPEEISKFALGFIFDNKTAPLAPPVPASAPTADSLDYRQHGILTPVRDQGNCGSCYAFATAGVLEAWIKRKLRGPAYDLSEQDVVDCSYRKQGYMNNGCGGGQPSVAFDHFNQKDIIMENQYPYVSGRGGTHYACRMQNKQYNYISGKVNHRHVNLRNEWDLKHYLTQYGPLVIGMAADSQYKNLFVNLGNGIFDVDYTINLQPNHVVVLVGYGSENGKNYWIIKNSWGTSWGNQGYGRIIAGKNMANIMTGGIWYIE